VSNEIKLSGAGPDYQDFWTIPADARTGRYEIDLWLRDDASRIEYPGAASFAVHRKLVRVDRVEFDRQFFVSGDPIACRIAVKNDSGRPLKGLRVEFSDSYFPWIAPGKYQKPVSPSFVAESVSLEPGAARIVSSPRATVAERVKQPSVVTYAVVIWDHDRKNIYDLFFTGPVFIHPPGIEKPKAYPFLYLYPELKYLGTNAYRRFYPPQLSSPSITFDTNHTMFPAGAAGDIGFTLTNDSGKPWRGVSVEARLLAPGGKEALKLAVARDMNLETGADPLKKSVHVPFPGEAGLYVLEVEAADRDGNVVARNRLELGVNPLPKSILIFAAHQDDDTAHPATIRAAVENGIPIHFVYFTSGDAGGCDRYYQRSCGPAEAMDFGELRMEESRASLAHEGVPRGNIAFLGLPDGGSEQIWYEHPDPAKPYLSVLLASDHAPYADAATPNLPYARRSAVDAAKQYIRKYKPEVIITGHPDEGHVDHRTNNWFVVKAMQELLKVGELSPGVVMLVDQVYGPGMQKAAPYRYQKRVLHVSGEVAARGQEATWFYQSQDGNHFQGALQTFDQLPREEVHWQILDWQQHEGWNEKR